jgi:hypothetical protein
MAKSNPKINRHGLPILEKIRTRVQPTMCWDGTDEDGGSRDGGKWKPCTTIVRVIKF